ncbi:hypothetical protein [Paenibacillus glucanolyticus]|uniref:hypothetical protein n=1 Tax=Paenibacillus glucanolyticus TaxID=59843 RepID=UPI00096E641D|nr:hypothetical protein [Paenibacillus glucanolyticus]OMF80907.1 hypothetical protein BK142_05720 [Paenibacillus glucanolyticus]
MSISSCCEIFRASGVNVVWTKKEVFITLLGFGRSENPLEGARLLELDIFILFFIGKSEKESERKKAEACERELGTVGLIFTLSA